MSLRRSKLGVGGWTVISQGARQLSPAHSAILHVQIHNVHLHMHACFFRRPCMYLTHTPCSGKRSKTKRNAGVEDRDDLCECEDTLHVRCTSGNGMVLITGLPLYIPTSEIFCRFSCVNKHRGSHKSSHCSPLMLR